MTCTPSCGDLSGWCARLWFLAASEGLDDAHRAATVWAWCAQAAVPDDLGGGEAHDGSSVIGFNATIFPSERDGVGIGADQTAV